MKEARILMLVDDSRDDLAFALRALRRLDFDVDVRTASDGREALAALHVRGSDDASEQVTPSVIFLDVRMPDVDGFEVLCPAHLPLAEPSRTASCENARLSGEAGRLMHCARSAELEGVVWH